MSTRLTPARGDTITLVDGDGNPTENVSLVSLVHLERETCFEVEDVEGEHFNVVRHPSMDTDFTRGWLEILEESE